MPALPLLLALAAAAPAPAGFVVFESNRGGAWGLWMAPLDGSAAEPLTSREPGRVPCCPHIAPDGKRVAWLDLPAARDRYEPEVAGVLKLTTLASRHTRVLAARALTYTDNRAAVWIDDGALLYIDAQAGPSRLELASGRSEALVVPRPREPWLLNATLTHATIGYPPQFSAYDREGRKLHVAMPRGGCQPYFTADGVWGYWVAGAGGPIHRIRLATGEVEPLLRRHDPRLPRDRSYMYFPMISRRQDVLVWAASDGAHDHFKADYDVFAAPLDPATLEISGAVFRLTRDPATDRFPDVWTPGGAAPPLAASRPTAAPAPAPAATAPGPSFVWEYGDRPNLVPASPQGEARAYPLRAHGRAVPGEGFALDLRGGWFEAGREAGERVVRAAKSTNELTLAIEISPQPASQSGPILAIGDDPGSRLLLLTQEDRRLQLWMRLQAPASAPPIALAGPAHLVLTYYPGRLRAYLDGKAVLDTEAVQGDFYHWKPRNLTLGGAPGHPGRWRGRLAGISLHGHAFTPAEAAAEYLRWSQLRRAPSPPAARVEGILRARSRTPELREISPYREALATFEYELAGGRRVRVAHFVLLDGEVLPAAVRQIGKSYSIETAPFAGRREVESLYLGDDLPPDPDLPFHYDPGF